MAIIPSVLAVERENQVLAMGAGVKKLAVLFFRGHSSARVVHRLAQLH
jgi:hypothetical protein